MRGANAPGCRIYVVIYVVTLVCLGTMCVFSQDLLAPPRICRCPLHVSLVVLARSHRQAFAVRQLLWLREIICVIANVPELRHVSTTRMNLHSPPEQ